MKDEIIFDGLLLNNSIVTNGFLRKESSTVWGSPQIGAVNRKVSNNEAEDKDQENERRRRRIRTRTGPIGRDVHDSVRTMADVRRTGALVQMQKRAEHVKSISSK